MYKERVVSCGHRISKALTLRDMKQSELCKLANVPKSSLSLYLSGAYEPKQDRIYAMAKALNVSEAWLMGYDVPMEKEIISPEEPKLSEGEKLWLDLYHRVSDETRTVLIAMMDSFDKVSTDKQQFLLELIRDGLGNQK